MIITDLTWLKKFVNIACFQIYKIIERFAWSRLALNGDFRYNLGPALRVRYSKDVNIQNSQLSFTE